MNTSLIALLRDPMLATRLTIAEWTDLLPRMKGSEILAHFDELLQLHGVDRDLLPPAVQRQLRAAASSAWVRGRSARWECGELSRLFRGSGIPVILLKGAAYLLTGALPGRGRFLGDVDILVPKHALPEIERRLLAGGWNSDARDDAEVEYYNEWLHQVPAFQHQVRLSMVDVHHNIIAPWGGHRVEIDPIFAHARLLDDGVLSVPSPLDQCLIVAAHFVRSEASDGAFRDLLDLDELMRTHAPDAARREALMARAREIGLDRALATASQFASALFGTHRYGRAPVAVRARAHALVPDGGHRRSLTTYWLRGGHYVTGLRAGLSWRIMFERTIRRRLGLTKAAKAGTTR